MKVENKNKNAEIEQKIKDGEELSDEEQLF